MAAEDDFTIPILSFGELGFLMKSIELSVLSLAPSDLSVALILYLSLSISFSLTRVKPAIPTFLESKY